MKKWILCVAILAGIQSSASAQCCRTVYPSDVIYARTVGCPVTSYHNWQYEFCHTIPDFFTLMGIKNPKYLPALPKEVTMSFKEGLEELKEKGGFLMNFNNPALKLFYSKDGILKYDLLGVVEAVADTTTLESFTNGWFIVSD